MAEFCLRAVDLETVGFLEEQPEAIQKDPRLGICELGFTDVLIDVGADNRIKNVEVDGGFGALLFRPSIAMPPEASAVHHLTDEHLAEQPECTPGALGALASSPPWRGPDKPFALVAAFSAFEEAWLAPYLPKDMRWICSVKVAGRLHPDWKSHANQAAKYRLGLDLPEALCHPPHRAGPDSFVTAHVIAAFIRQGCAIRQMLEWTRLPKLMLTCPIGKDWRGKTWDALDDSSLRWISDKGADMDPDVLYWARAELQKRELMRRQPELSGDYE